MAFAVSIFGGLALLLFHVGIRYRRYGMYTFNQFVIGVLVSFGISTGVATVLLPAIRYSYRFIIGDPAFIQQGRITLATQDFETILTAAVIGSLLIVVFAGKGYFETLRSGAQVELPVETINKDEGAGN